MNDNLKNVIKKSNPLKLKILMIGINFILQLIKLFDGYSLNINNPNNEWIKKTNDADIFQ